MAAGLQLKGKQWGRPDDTVGVAGVVNGISAEHQAYLNAGGLGILVGDGMLPHPGAEQIIEAYYSYAMSASTHITADYQFIDNPGLQFGSRSGFRVRRALSLAVLNDVGCGGLWL